MQLRPYQEEAKKFATKDKEPVLIQAPTGSGKTVTASAIAKEFIDMGQRVGVFVPRRELAYQFDATLKSFGVRSTILMAGVDFDSRADCWVCSIQTIQSRFEEHNRPEFDAIIIDEAHLMITESRQSLFESYLEDKTKIVGLTATPIGPGNKGLGALYSDMFVSPPLGWFIDNGFLVPVRYFTPVEVDLEGVPVFMGDYKEEELLQRLLTSNIIGEIVPSWEKIAKGRKTIVFCLNKSHARFVNQEFVDAGYRFECVFGDTPKAERKAIFESLERGDLHGITNVQVGQYGLDIPPLEVAVLATATKSTAMLFQMVGRVLRTYDGKEYAYIIDHGNNIAEHGFVEDDFAWSLEGKDQQEDAKKERELEAMQNPESSPTTCPKCKATFKNESHCPNCGFDCSTIQYEKVMQIKAKFQEIMARERRLEQENLEKINIYSQLIHNTEGDERKIWYANEVYNKHFNEYPGAVVVQHAKPAPPDRETKKIMRNYNLWQARKQKGVRKR